MLLFDQVAQRALRVMQPRFHRTRRDAGDRGNLIDRYFFKEVQREHFAMRDRQLPQRRVDALGRLDPRCILAGVAHIIGDGLRIRGLKQPLVGALFPKLADRAIARDPVEPRAHRARLGQLTQSLERNQPCLLEHIPRIAFVAQVSTYEVEQSTLETVGQLSPSRGVAAATPQREQLVQDCV